jgi:hypothetical protein
LRWILHALEDLQRLSVDTRTAPSLSKMRIALRLVYAGAMVVDVVAHATRTDWHRTGAAAVNIARRHERREPLFAWEKRPA